MLETVGKQREHPRVEVAVAPAPHLLLVEEVANLGSRIATLVWLIWVELTGNKRPLS
jgi:hypothetical protein